MSKLVKFKGIELEEGTFTRKDYEDRFALHAPKDKLVYCEYSNGDWNKWKYDEPGNPVYIENSKGEIWREEE